MLRLGADETDGLPPNHLAI